MFVANVSSGKRKFKVVGDSQGQVRRILIQMGISNAFDCDITEQRGK